LLTNREEEILFLKQTFDKSLGSIKCAQDEEIKKMEHAHEEDRKNWKYAQEEMLRNMKYAQEEEIKKLNDIVQKLKHENNDKTQKYEYELSQRSNTPVEKYTLIPSRNPQVTFQNNDDTAWDDMGTSLHSRPTMPVRTRQQQPYIPPYRRHATLPHSPENATYTKENNKQINLAKESKIQQKSFKKKDEPYYRNNASTPRYESTHKSQLLFSSSGSDHSTESERAPSQLSRYSSNDRSRNLHNQSNRSYKLPHLKLGEFKGEYWSGFIRQFERMAANEGWTEEDILNTFSYCLRDEAREFYSVLTDEQTSNWEILKAEFTQRFGKGEPPESVMWDLSGTVQ
jgi:hypothetical protein